MEDAEKAHTEEPEEAPRTRSDRFLEVYVNNVQIGLSPWDVNLLFARVVSTVGMDAVNEEQVGVVMSPQHAKALLVILAKNIAAWEKQFGVISVPQQFMINLTRRVLDSDSEDSKKPESDTTEQEG